MWRASHERSIATMSDRLTALDNGFLAAEHPGVPLHIGGIARFEGGPLLDGDGRVRIDDIRRVVAAHLGAIPRFRRRLADPPLHSALPEWVDAEDFDVAGHVEAVTVPAPGDQEALIEVACEILRTPLDRSRPLWHLTFLDGLDDGSVVLVDRAHHALVDGVSGSDSLITMLDPAPDSQVPDVPDWRAQAPPAGTRQLLDVAGRLARLPFAAARSSAELVRSPERLRELFDGLVAVVRSEVPAPSCSLNAEVGPARRHLSVRLSLAELKRVAHAHGVTLNDVVLAAVTGGLRDLMAGRGELEGLDHLVALVPVSTRAVDGRDERANQVSGIFAKLPVGLDDPLERLQALASQMREHKASHEVDIVADLLALLDWLPPWVLRPLADLTVNRQAMVNLVITNVPGSPRPLYLLGPRMLEFLPYVPLGGNTTVGIAILSYDGHLDVGITADPDAAPDADVLVEGIRRSFDELLSSSAKVETA